MELTVSARRALTEKVKAKALEEGFSRVGVARAESLTQEGDHLREWLRRGYHASMNWMERNLEKRVDPRGVLPGARSVVCVGMNYYTPTPHTDDPDAGKISRYAWGDDYHIVLTSRLESLLDCIKQEQPSVNGRLYIDTGPVMDKAWAVRSGIGWLGKHTNIITREYGSWVFLGEIILDVELEYDEPIADLCGSCLACIEACPTGAITDPYVLDSTKCISYLTIEHRGDIPDGVATQFEGWLYGCDICQDVCPWNRFQKPSGEQAFKARASNIAPNLHDLVEITKEEFAERFRRSPIKRAKREGLIRNAKNLIERSHDDRNESVQ
ncbi:MAG TPA: tRNA epoxyqueuosine(34) reductase QueG [Bacteroidetes bacterium]|nr:tRNA epoxyqueuosine(34) reductase QueG [Bacteroidota bacterium]